MPATLSPTSLCLNATLRYAVHTVRMSDDVTCLPIHPCRVWHLNDNVNNQLRTHEGLFTDGTCNAPPRSGALLQIGRLHDQCHLRAKQQYLQTNNNAVDKARRHLAPNLWNVRYSTDNVRRWALVLRGINTLCTCAAVVMLLRRLDSFCWCFDAKENCENKTKIIM